MHLKAAVELADFLTAELMGESPSMAMDGQKVSTVKRADVSDRLARALVQFHDQNGDTVET